jgi:hypothetical protein
MRRLVDVVNFNGDGSCLSSETWLQALRGGDRSLMCSWLRIYVDLRRRVSLGLIGATVADISAYNPEALALIREHPEIFESLLRPFSHDIALLRSDAGFTLNIRLGQEILSRELGAVVPAYLPPEFMLTNGQVALLSELGATATFINASRFRPEVQSEIPAVPYLVEGVLGKTLRCIPLDGTLTHAYLRSVQLFDDSWNRAVTTGSGTLVGAWRDGEGAFFLPRGIERERAWLAAEDPSIERLFVRDILASASFDRHGGSYPVHSFSEWVKEFRMLGYVHRLEAVEARIETLSATEQILLFCAANSDVMSAVEKEAPRVRVRDEAGGSEREVILHRSCRGFEGEEFLAILEGWRTKPEVRRWLRDGGGAHLAKMRARTRAVGGDNLT